METSIQPTPIEPSNYNDTIFDVKIKKLNTTPPPQSDEIYPENSVIFAEWHLTGLYNDITVDLDGISYFSIPDESNFIPFNDLTEELLKNWIENTDTFIFHKYTVCNNILKIMNESVSKLPWENQ